MTTKKKTLATENFSRTPAVGTETILAYMAYGRSLVIGRQNHTALSLTEEWRNSGGISLAKHEGTPMVSH